jgi:hypothetical protein
MKKLRRHFRVAPLVIPQRAQITAHNLHGIVAEKDLKGKRNLRGASQVEMSPRRQSRNVPFWLGHGGVRVNRRVPVKRSRAMLASKPIKE